MSDTSMEKLSRLFDVISDNSELSDDEIKRELIADGVAVDDFLFNARRTIRQEIQAKIKEQATRQREERRIRNSHSLQMAASWTPKECLEFISSVMNGGEGYNANQQQVALAFRNKQSGELSEEELRSCVNDIIFLGSKNEE